MRRCRVGERGGLLFAELIAASSECGLRDIDLSANQIGFKGTIAIEQALIQRKSKRDLRPVNVDLEGNLVLQEVMNGLTHGLGTLLSLLGAWLMSRRVRSSLVPCSGAQVLPSTP